LKTENANLNKQISELLDVIKLSKDEVAELNYRMMTIELENSKLKENATEY
jgi:hypothetical protein